MVVKRTVGFEFPMYVFDPEKHADGDKGQDEAEEGRGSGSGSGSGDGNEHNSN